MQRQETSPAHYREWAHALIERGFVQVEVETDDLAPRMATAFVDLVENWPEGPTCWPYQAVPTNGTFDPDTGLWHSTGNPDPVNPERTKDKKYTLHFRHDLWGLLAAHNPAMLQRHEPLFRDCETMLRRFQACLRGIYTETDKLLGTNIASLVGREGRDQDDVLRILGYSPDDATQELLGKPHWDRDANTFQFYESCPGLEGRTRRDGWFPISSAPNRPWLFNGGKAEVATGGLMERAGHRIRRYKDLPPFSPRIARVSQMGFMHLHSLTVPSEWNTHQLKF